MLLKWTVLLYCIGIVSPDSCQYSTSKGWEKNICVEISFLIIWHFKYLMVFTVGFFVICIFVQKFYSSTDYSLKSVASGSDMMAYQEMENKIIALDKIVGNWKVCVLTFFKTLWLTRNHNLCRTSSSNSSTCNF